MNSQQNPKVFISHAREDKERFVLEFATELRDRGIDAWVDKWEILPGDSLVDKIFEEGIDEAQAMIIVLSKNSVDKPWVREELNAGVIKRITSEYKLIPVIIDECEVPKVLQSTAWEKIEDLNEYSSSLNLIIDSIYGQSSKPPLGSPPIYSSQTVHVISGIEMIDTLVFKTAVESSLQEGSNLVHAQNFVNQLNEMGISEEKMYESIDILSDLYYIKGPRTAGAPGLSSFFITPYGFDRYAQEFLPQFENFQNKVLLAIVNLKIDNNHAIATHMEEPRILIDYALELLKRRGLITITKTAGNNINVPVVSTKGQRVARSL